MTAELRELIREMAREVEIARGEVLEERRIAEEARLEERWEERRAKEKKRFDQDWSTLFSDGPLCDPCPQCRSEMRAQWKFCPRCSHPSENACLFCHAFLPKMEDLQFCPACGNRIR